MRVTEEIDGWRPWGFGGLAAGFAEGPGLIDTMPLVVWCSAAGLVGGMVSANLEWGWLTITYH